MIYHATQDAMQQTTSLPKEEQAKGMEVWMVWAKKCGYKLVDLGAPLMGGQQLNSDGSSAGSSKGVAGYFILQADSMEDAKKLLQGHPHLGWNASCTIEVHETMPLPGM